MEAARKVYNYGGGGVPYTTEQSGAKTYKYGHVQSVKGTRNLTVQFTTDRGLTWEVETSPSSSWHDSDHPFEVRLVMR